MQVLYPEVAAGGFSRMDGGIDFYTRVNSLLSPEMTVVDLGAGRGVFTTRERSYIQDLMMLRGKVARVIGLDIDPVVMENESVDEAHVLAVGGPFPLEDNSVDLIVSDFTFEHLDDPDFTAGEMDRVLKPGGWICARTPNKYGYIALGATLVPNSLHVKVLKRAMPDRDAQDVFPTRYRLNTPARVRATFPGYEVISYTHEPEPSYFGNSTMLWRAALVAGRLTPNSLGAMRMFFLHKPTA